MVFGDARLPKCLAPIFFRLPHILVIEMRNYDGAALNQQGHTAWIACAACFDEE
jgi:hypothetical protein